MTPQARFILTIAAVVLAFVGVTTAATVFLRGREAVSNCHKRGGAWDTPTESCRFVSAAVVSQIGTECPEMGCPQGLICKYLRTGVDGALQRCVFDCNGDLDCPAGYWCNNRDCTPHPAEE